MKKTIIATTLTMSLILTACGNSNTNTTETSEPTRFVQSDQGVGMVTDTKTGCEYIRTGGYTSWTYVHGSCPEVIASESK